jgi:hypothetical protein
MQNQDNTEAGFTFGWSLVADGQRLVLMKTKSAQGKVRYTSGNRKLFYLGSKDPRRGKFEAPIPLKDPGSFVNDPHNLYHLGDEVNIAGKFIRYQDGPIIYVTDPAHLGIII